SSRPALGGITPEMALKKVVLPAPLGPMMPTSSPPSIATETPSTAVRPPKRTVTSRADSSASLLASTMPRLPAPPARQPSAQGLPAQRREAARQVQHRQDQQQAQR